MILIQVLVLILKIILASFVLYLLVLTIAAQKASKHTLLTGEEPTIRFLILIPAYNEERLISSTLENLAKLDYPAKLFSICVVADNCTDLTASKARMHGAVVFERFDANHRGKGYALQWLMDILKEKRFLYNAIVILDADSILSSNFLQVMNARLQRGERAIQAYYSVRAPEQSPISSLRYAALAVIHFLRPQGRMFLGGSAGLKGNGMVFSADLFKNMHWSPSITEDIDQHVSLISNDERVTFAPDAIVWGEMPRTLEKSKSQNIRWEAGRQQMARKYVIPLLKKSYEKQKNGHRQSSFTFFDAALELLIPPFSLLVSACLGLFLLDLIFLLYTITISSSQSSIFLNRTNLILGLFLMIGLLTYLLSGLRMVQAPGYIYQNLLSAPVFMTWKIWQQIIMLFGREQKEWVRTPRNEV